MKTKTIILASLFFLSCSSNALFTKSRFPNNDEPFICSGFSYQITDSSRTDYTVNPLPFDLIYTFTANRSSYAYLRVTLPAAIYLGMNFITDTNRIDKKFNIAAGFLTGIDLAKIFNDTNRLDFFEFRIPVFLNYNPSKYLGMSFIPNISVRYRNNYGMFLSGVNLSSTIGNKFGVIPEASVLYNFKFKVPEYQVGICAFIPIAGLFKMDKKTEVTQ